MPELIGYHFAVLMSERGMIVQRLMCMVEESGGIYVQVLWKVLVESDDTMEPLTSITEDLKHILLLLLQRKNAPWQLVAKVRLYIAL